MHSTHYIVPHKSDLMTFRARTFYPQMERVIYYGLIALVIIVGVLSSTSLCARCRPE